MLIALNKNGFNDINRIISESNTSGFYYKNRIDKELLLSLDPKNIIVTTACIAGRLFKTDNYKEEFLYPVHNHFKEHFYLEVQSHLAQATYNNKIMQLHYTYNIPIIHANDSHYILPGDSKYRDLFLKAKGMLYPEEDKFILDYPDSDEIFDRYKKQGILSKEEVKDALNNTLIFDQCEDLNFTDEIKIPKIHKDKDSNKLLKEILYKEWEIKKESIPIEKHKECIDAIELEFKVIEETGMADYFIDDYEIVKKAVNKYNAFLTPTGRGSAVSFVDNCILGFTQVNRIINNSIPLFPSRFMSKARILQTRSLPD